MSAERPRIILAPGTALDPALRERLAAEYELVDASTVAGRSAALRTISPPLPDATAAAVLDALGEGVGIVEAGGEIAWMNHELAVQSPDVLRKFVDTCTEVLNSARSGAVSLDGGTSERRTFRVGSRSYEVVASGLAPSTEPAPGNGAIDGALIAPDRIAALLLDVTEGRRVQERLDAIDTAGADLLRMDAEAIESINPAERLKMLDGRVVAAVRNVFGWDHFEFRLLNRETQQLELVFCNGLAPLGIGEKIFAKPVDNGISGLVATSGEGYVCHDVEHDPRYLRGLPGARSALTIPLRLHDHVVGIFNAESDKLDAFGDEDRYCAEVFGRYVALALNILDMLVVERRTTNRRVATNVMGEISGPLDSIARAAESIEEGAEQSTIELAEKILDAVSSVKHRIEAATSGPQTILGVEEILREGEREPSFEGKRVLVADDEASIRDTIVAVLVQKGCDVTSFSSGGPAIEAIRSDSSAGMAFDLVISDVRMPDRNGYEVFKAVKDLKDPTPVILMTGFGYDPHHSIVRCSQEGLHCFLFKPFQVTQLIEEVRKAFDIKAPT
ncbi:MAG: response regulator [Phycisphaerae bacterium]|nr:response regulator [Phycisphaerae bacterium]